MTYLTNIHRIGKIKKSDDEKLWLTKSFTLDACPERAIIRADSQGVCGIYVNGEFIDASSGRYCNRITCFEVTSKLHTGENEIGLALGGYFYDSKGKQMYVRRGFHFAAAALELELINGESRETVTTDRSWICESDEGKENADSFSCVTVAEYDRFWRAAALWAEQKRIDVPKAILDTVGDAYREYTEKTLPKFMYPEKIIEKTENSIVYDFGRLYVGYPTLEYESETDGNVTFKFDYSESAEDFNEDGKFFGSSKGLNITEKIKKGKHTLTVHNRRASRFVKLIFDAEMKDFSYSYRLSMMPYGKLGWFECNEPVFNKMWEVGKYTLHVNKHREYESCPRNEMKYFSGDGIIAALIDYYAFGDAPLVDASLSLTEIACNGGICNDIYERNLPLWDYPAWRIITAYNHYRYTNDKDFVKRYYSELKRNTEWMINKMNDRCLIYQYPLYWAPFYRGSEAVEWTCSPDRLGEKPSLNSLFYKSLSCMSELAKIADDRDGKEYEELAKKVKNAINEYLWSDEKGAYLESCDSSYIPQDGNALAVLFGIADEKRAKTLYETICRENWSSCGSAILSKDTGDEEHTRGGSRTVSPVSCMYEAEGRFLNGDANGALELMRRVWGTMLRKGAETFWEFCPNDENKRWPIPSHAWSGGCTYLLSAYVLGIRPAEPGYEKMLFSPCAELDSFRGVVPTVKGLVAVTCETVDGKKQYKLTIPKDADVVINLPENATVTLNEY